MIWARWRGGNPPGTPRAVGVGQQPSEAVLLVVAAEAPDSGGIALPARGDAVDRFASGNGQDDTGTLDLEEPVWRPLIYLMFVIIGVEFLLATLGGKKKEVEG